MSDWYILKDRRPVPAEMIEAANWKEEHRDECIVAKTERGGVTVSTVFLGLDHSFTEGGPPVLFETLVFGGSHDGEMERCRTWGEAEEQHERMCRKVWGDALSDVILDAEVIE